MNKFERNKLSPESLKVGFRHRCMEIGWLHVGISVDGIGLNTMNKDIIKMPIIEKNCQEHVVAILELLYKNDIPLKILRKHVNIRFRNRQRIRRLRRHKAKFILIIEMGTSYEETQRIRGMYGEREEVEGVIYQNQIYPVSKGRKIITY